MVCRGCGASGRTSLVPPAGLHNRCARARACAHPPLSPRARAVKERWAEARGFDEASSNVHPDTAREVVMLCCAIKPLAGWNAEQAASTCRERCGGQVCARPSQAPPGRPAHEPCLCVPAHSPRFRS